MKSRWEDVSPGGEAYAERFAKLAESGVDVHGEATFVERITAPGARVLDAGCGTGRVAIRLAERGFRVDGVDVDASMLRIAKREAPDLTWVRADLSKLGDAVPGPYDVIVAAGNVLPLLAAGTEAAAIAGMAARLAPDGLLVVGFGLDPAHLPLESAPFGLIGYDAWCAEAGLTLRNRYSSWDGDPFDDDDHDGSGYAVSVHCR
ncbi:MAG TPA: class I SAM-dependent methyltransferase [Mycobacteriales bacterium]